MVEYHVDACDEFQEKMNRETRFGGTLSVRFPEEEKNLLHSDMMNASLNNIYLPRNHGLDQMESQHMFQKMKARA